MISLVTPLNADATTTTSFAFEYSLINVRAFLNALSVPKDVPPNFITIRKLVPAKDE